MQQYPFRSASSAAAAVGAIPAMIVGRAVGAALSLVWGPGCVIRRTIHSFIWGPDDAGCSGARQHCGLHHQYRVTCIPPCYGCRR